MTHTAFSRRTLMRGGLAAGLLTVPGVRHVAYAAGGAGGQDRTLVVVFLRGGADTLNLVAPADDPDYVAARAPDMRVSTGGAGAGLPIAQRLAPAVDFRLHPEAAPLADLYTARHLTIIPATGIPDGTRSHFVAQDLMERGVAAEADLSRTPTGWAARWAAAPGPGGAGPLAVAAASSTPAALAGDGAALAVNGLQYGLAPPGGPRTAAVLQALHANDPTPYGRAGRAALDGLARVDARLPRAQPGGPVEPYAAEGGAVYEDTEAGRGLLTVARLLKMDLGVRLAWVDVGGWDTHENQPPRFAAAVRQLSRALAAFHADTSRFHGSLAVVVMTEFGRRLRSNRSQGTDHGHAGTMLVLGGGVGGGMLGRWPGLATAQLDRGVDLAVTTDYRAVLSAVMGPAAARSVFPGYGGGPLPGLWG